MMEWVEKKPLPLECEMCEEGECYQCEIAAERWYLSEIDEFAASKEKS